MNALRDSGPWSSRLDARSMQLSLFWRRRLAMLSVLPGATVPPARMGTIALIVLAVALLGMPSLELSRAPAAAPDDAAKTAGQPLKIELPGGAIVELVALADYPTHGGAWWAPDGTPTAAPYHALESKVYDAPPNRVVREMAIRWLRRPPAGVDVTWTAGDEGWHVGGRALDGEQKPISDVAGTADAFPSDAKTATLVFSIATTPWHTAATSDGQRASASGDGKAGVILTPASQHDLGLHISAAHDVLDEQVRIVAINRRGATITPWITNTGKTRGFVQTTANFPKMTLAEVREFQVQTRSFRRVEVRDIALHSGHVTHPEIVPVMDESPH